MAKVFVVDGVRYVLPDDATIEELEETLNEQANKPIETPAFEVNIDLARPEESDVSDMLKRPKPPPLPVRPELKIPEPRVVTPAERAAAQRQIDATLNKEIALGTFTKGLRATTEEGVIAETNRRIAERRQELERELGAKKVLPPTAGMLPILRPSRIKEIETGAPSLDPSRLMMSVPLFDEQGEPVLNEKGEQEYVTGLDPLRETEYDAAIAAREAKRKAGEFKRVYEDPNVPIQSVNIGSPVMTGLEQFESEEKLPKFVDVESFPATQRKLIGYQQREPTGLEEITEAFARTPVMTEAQILARKRAFDKGQADKAVIKNLLSTREGEGSGSVESILATGMRVLGAPEALATEAYFRGLGYEVDEQGQPVDKSDLGYKLHDAVTRALDVVGLQKPLGLFPATRRETYEQGLLDPEAMRRAAPAEADLARQVAEQIKSGRGFSDEFLNSPEIVEGLTEVFGEDAAPVAALGAGLVASFMFGGITDEAVKALGRLGKVVGKAKATSAATRATLIRKELDRAVPDKAPIPVKQDMFLPRTRDPVPDEIKNSGDIEKIVDYYKTNYYAPEELRRNPDLPDNLRKRLQMATVDDYVRVSDNVAVRADVAGEVKRKVEMDVKRFTDAEEQKAKAFRAGTSTQAPLPPDKKRVAITRIRDASALREAGLAAKKLNELSVLQVDIDDVDRLMRPLFASILRRNEIFAKNRANLYTRALKAEQAELTPQRVSAKQLEQRLNREGDKLLPTIKKELETLLSEKDPKGEPVHTLDSALDALRGMYVPHDRQYTFAKQVLDDSYGMEYVSEQIMKRRGDKYISEGVLQEGEVFPLSFEELLDLDIDPLYKSYVPQGRLQTIGSRRRGLMRNYIKAIIEHGLRAKLAKGLLDEYEFAYGIDKAPITLIDDETAIRYMGKTYNVLPIEQNLIEGAKEAVDALERVPLTRYKAEDTNAIQRTADAAARLYKAVKLNTMYGLIIPSVSQLTTKALRAPIIMLSTIGAEHSLRTLGVATKRLGVAGYQKILQVLKNPEAVALNGITTIDGVKYSPEDLEYLVDKYGVGTTQIDSERIGRLTDDILDAVESYESKQLSLKDRAKKLFTTPNKLGRAADTAAGFFVNPNLVQRLVGDAENALRRQVFFAALAAGKLPEEASTLARRSMLDVRAMNPVIRDQVAMYVAAAGTSYEFWTRATKELAKNPAKAAAIMNAQRVQANYYNPTRDQQDAYLKNIGVANVANKDLLLFDNPTVYPIEAALNTMQTIAPLTNANFMEVYRRLANRFSPEDTISGLSSFVKRDGATLDLSDAEQTIASLPEQDRLFYQALVLSTVLDPDVGNTIFSILNPKQIYPPPTAVDPSDQKSPFWSRPPEDGLPYFKVKLLNREDPLYAVFRPSKDSIKAIKAFQELQETIPFETVANFADKSSDLYLAYSLGKSTFDTGELVPAGMAGEMNSPGAILLTTFGTLAERPVAGERGEAAVLQRQLIEAAKTKPSQR